MPHEPETETDVRIDPIEALMLPEAATAMLERLEDLLTNLADATDEEEWRSELLEERATVEFVRQTLNRHMARLLILAAANGPAPNGRH